MNFDIKDVKSWGSRHDVNAGDVGYVTCDFNNFLLTTNVALVTKATVKAIDDNDSRCFLAQPLNGKVIFKYGFFLPLNAVKKDEPKVKYRPFVSMRELTEIIYSKDWEYNNLSVGDSLLIRRKGDEHFHQNLLITSIEYDENNVISMNEKSMQEWLDNFEFLSQRRWRPFGVEVKDE